MKSFGDIDLIIGKVEFGYLVIVKNYIYIKGIFILFVDVVEFEV